MIDAQKGVDTLMIAPALMTNSATQTGTIDCRGADFATIRIGLSAEINTNAIGPTLSVTHGITTDATNGTTIVADRTAEDITTATEVRYEVDCRTLERILRLSITSETTTNDDVTVSAVGTLTRNEQAPASAAALGDDVVVIV